MSLLGLRLAAPDGLRSGRSRGDAPMNDYSKEPDVASLVAFITFVGLWGFLSCAVVLQLAALG
jgi:hypothetical protein